MHRSLRHYRGCVTFGPLSVSSLTHPPSAEILVDVVDVVLDGFAIPEKLLGITLFALVPNTTEFMNAISFALNGNIALSCVRRVSFESLKLMCTPGRMEIGSAYALQVCLIQIPAMLAFTAWYGIGKETMAHRAFTCVDLQAQLRDFADHYSSLQPCLPALGRHRHHLFNLPPHLRLHRGALDLLPRLAPLLRLSHAPRRIRLGTLGECSSLPHSRQSLNFILQGRDTSDNPSLQPHTLVASAILPCTLTFAGKAKALFLSLFTH